MRYKIYGNDTNSVAFVRRLSLTDDMDASDAYNIIERFWMQNILTAAEKEYERTEDESKKPNLILGSDKDGCLSLLMHVGSSIRRLGILLPETHPLFNFDTILKKWQFLENKTQLLFSVGFAKQIETFL